MNVTRKAFTRQYEHIGSVRHGVQTGPYRVEFDAPVADVDGALNIKQGSIVSLDANGAYIVGCPVGDTANKPVPFISMKNINDPDVMTGRAGKTQKDTTYGAMGGVITAIPCTCGYELETTEFDDSVTYAPNDGLVPAEGENVGKLTKATTAPGGEKPYAGFVSLPASPDYFGNTRLAFFANFIPANFA